MGDLKNIETHLPGPPTPLRKQNKPHQKLFFQYKAKKFVSVTFSLVCFLSLKESTYFTLKNFFHIQKIEVKNFRNSNFMTSSNS